MSALQLAADLGDDDARRRLRAWLGRLAERAASGSEHAREFLAENPDLRRYLVEPTS